NPFSGIPRNWVGVAFFGLLILFPFIFSLLAGMPVDAGEARYWQGQLVPFFIYAVMAMSYDLLFGYTGILTFGHAAFFGMGGYALGIFLKHVGPKLVPAGSVVIGTTDLSSTVALLLAFLVVVVICALLGLLFSLVSARVKGVYFAMVTLAMAEAIYILIKASDFVTLTGADEGLQGIPVAEWINPFQNRLTFYYVALIFFILSYLVLRRITHSPTGRVLVAIRENEDRVRMIGYNPAVYRTIAFVVAAVAAGLAGAMLTIWNTSASPRMVGASTTIDALIMTILGGVGTLVGPIVGAGLLKTFESFFYQWFGPRWPLVFGVIFIALVIFLPYGIVGTWRVKGPGWKAAWRRWMEKLRAKRKP
ncbi:MAG TPA: branched-chain amino acid ABC transporter permease, partial [Anaerolineaceae bacterium]|nr:branched-chain amino acid ABC transporter permease [Anaerolineaceae bacterium]